MKHKCFAAVVLAAALLLTGCGGAAAPAAPAGSGAASQSAAGTAVQTAQKERITDQWSLEKTVRGEMIGVMKLSIHVPQLVCDSPDAAALNEELAAMYAAEYMDYGGNAAFSLCESAAQFAPIGFAYRLFLRRRVTACRIFAKQKCKEISARHGIWLCPMGYTQGH